MPFDYRNFQQKKRRPKRSKGSHNHRNYHVKGKHCIHQKNRYSILFSTKYIQQTLHKNNNNINRTVDDHTSKKKCSISIKPNTMIPFIESQTIIPKSLKMKLSNNCNHNYSTIATLHKNQTHFIQFPIAIDHPKKTTRRITFENLAYLPQSASDIGMIESTNDKNIIWLIAGYYFKKIYYYNKQENKMIENKCNFLDLEFTEERQKDDLTCINVVTGILPNTLLMFVNYAEFLNAPFYCIFDTKLKTWQSLELIVNYHNCDNYNCNDIYNNIINDMDKNYSLTNKFSLLDDKHYENENENGDGLSKSNIFHSVGRNVQRINDYLIITGRIRYGSVDHKNIQMSIFKIKIINDIQYPQLMKRISFHALTKYCYHGSIVLEKSVNTNQVKLLLFGGTYMSFVNSFCQINIDLDKIECDYKNGCQIYNKIDKNEQGNAVNVVPGIKIDYNPSISINCNCWQSNLRGLNLFDRYMSLYDTWCYFSYHWYKSRYLIIIGGLLGSNKILDAIVYFDIIKEKWNILKEYKLPKKILGHRSIITNDNILHIIGGCEDIKFTITSSHHWKFNLTKNISWKIERIIWLGFYGVVTDYTDYNQFRPKNRKKIQQMVLSKRQCLLPILPKDVVFYILDFLRNQCIFDQE